jgi:hypothetical protein
VVCLPPAEYDDAYSGGQLTIFPARGQKQVRDMCPSGNFNLGIALGCSIRGALGCFVVLAPDADIQKAGFRLN